MSEPQVIERLPDDPRRTLPAVTPMQMLQMAIERGADVVMLEKLLALQERWEANEARKAFVTALAAFKKTPPTVTKNKMAGFGEGNKRTEYKYATLDQVCDAICPALSEHGLSHRWETSQADGKIRVACILTHVLGHSERVTLEAGADTSGSKNAIQAIGSAVAYLSRYTLLAITGLATEDDDAKVAVLDPISPEQKEELIALLRETNSDTRKFLAYIDADAIDEIPATKFNDARAALVKKKGTKP